MYEEARIRHLVERGQSAQQNRDAAVAEPTCKEEVLFAAHQDKDIRGVSERALTNSVIARVYKTRMNRNLKKCAASSARPAIQ